MYNICKNNVSWNGWIDGHMDEWQARGITRGKNRIKWIDKIYLYKLLLWFSLWNISSHLQYCYTIYFSKCCKDIIYNMSKTYVPVCTSRYKPMYRHIHMYICDLKNILFIYSLIYLFLFICYVSVCGILNAGVWAIWIPQKLDGCVGTAGTGDADL